MFRIKHLVTTAAVLVVSVGVLAPAAQAKGDGMYPQVVKTKVVPFVDKAPPVDNQLGARIHDTPLANPVEPKAVVTGRTTHDHRRHRLDIPGDGRRRARPHHHDRRRSDPRSPARAARHVVPGGPCSVGGGARRHPQRPAHEPRRLVRPARLADRPRAAARPLPAAGARDGAVADRPAVPGGGPGRRHADRDPRPGAGRARHHHRRRAAPRELLEPVRHRPCGRRHRQPGDGARPQRPPNPVPRVVGPIERRHPVQVRDVQFLRSNTSRSRSR